MKRRVTTLTLTTVLVALGCAGCGTPPWQEGTSATPTPARASSTAARPASPTIAASIPAPVAINDLATGSAKRKLNAGGVRLSINYWSTLAMSDWTGTASKPVNLSASAKFIDGSEQDIFLARVTVNLEVHGPDGPLVAPAPLVDETSIIPGYLVTSPSSYGQVFTIPALAPKATSVSLSLTYELLAQTEPDADTYAKQTANDTLTIPIQP